MGNKHMLLLVVGIAVLVKSVWGLAAPASFRRAAAVGVRWGERLRYAVSILLLAGGVFTWGIVLIHEPLSSRMLGIFALFLAGMAVVWLDPRAMRSMAQFFVTGRSALGIRLVSVVAAVLAVWMIWAAATGR